MVTEYIIRKLTVDDFQDVYNVMESNTKFQLMEKDRTWRTKLIKHVTDRLSWPGVNNFGAFLETGALAAFYDTLRWDYRNYSLNTASVNKLLTFEKSPGSRWPKIIIDLCNHAVAYYEKELLITGWTMRPTDPKWEPVASAPECVLSQGYNFEVVKLLEPNESLVGTEYYNVAPGGLPHPQEIVRWEKPGAVEWDPIPLQQAAIQKALQAEEKTELVKGHPILDPTEKQTIDKSNPNIDHNPPLPTNELPEPIKVETIHPLPPPIQE